MTGMRASIAAAIVVVLVLGTVTGACASDELLFDVQPVTLDGRTLVPLRPIFEWLGARVTYEGGHISAWRSEEAKIPQVELWIGSTQAKIAEAEVDGPGRVAIGEEASFDVFITFEGDPYPTDELAFVKYLVFDANNELVFEGEAEAVEDGLYNVTLTAEQTGELEAGANKLQVAVSSTEVAIPTFASFEFVTE